MTRKRECLQAYFAGLFDGEGTVGVYNTDGHWRLSVGIHQIEPLSIGLLWTEYSEATFKWTADKRFQFNLYGDNARRFLEDLKPYLILKSDQVKLALAFLNYKSRLQAERRRTGNRPNAPYTVREHSRFQWFSDRLKDAKRSIGVNSVNTWPDKSREYRSKRDEAESDVKQIREHLEGVETRLSESNKARSAPEKDIVQS